MLDSYNNSVNNNKDILAMSIINKLMYKSLLTAGIFVEKNFIKSNMDTEIGRKYNFKNINSIEDFKKSFPLTEYNFYNTYIQKMAIGKKNVLFKDDIEYFCHTSGTTGKQKLIPVTKKAD